MYFYFIEKIEKPQKRIQFVSDLNMNLCVKMFSDTHTHTERKFLSD